MTSVNTGNRNTGSILITGGRLLDQTGERAGDVRVVDGRIAEVGDGLAVA